jgi:plastocyanin
MMNNTRWRLAMLSGCILALGAASCSSGDGANNAKSTIAPTAGSTAGTTADPGAGAAPPGAGVTISNFAFSAATVASGTEFTITNSDSAKHTFTDDGGAFNVSVAGGASSPLTVAAPGTYKVHCEIHSSMHGTIIVT